MSPDDIGTLLAEALHADAETVRPEPALQRILARTQPAPARTRRFWPVLVSAMAAGALVATAILLFGSGGTDRPRTGEPPVATTTVAPGDEVQLAVFYTNSFGDLLSGGFRVTSTGDLGIDAVQALLNGRQEGFGNPWSGVMGRPEPIAEVRSVTHESGQITVDFDRELTASASLEQDRSFGQTAIQQLVHTVQSALRSWDPVLITVNGEPADEAFGVPLDGPVAADWSVVTGIRPQTPAQGATVTSPVEVSGESTAFEGTINWQVEQDGAVVDEGFTTGGSMGEYAPYAFTIELPPGAYTLKLWEENPSGGQEGLAPQTSLVYLDFTVE